MKNLKPEFKDRLVKFNPKYNFTLSPYTTWKIGGKADILVEIKSSQELEELTKLAIDYKVPYTILGKGSNVLVSDKGISDLVIINFSKNISLINQNLTKQNLTNPFIAPRHTDTKDKNYYQFDDLDFEEKGIKKEIEVDSGVFLPLAINWSLKNKLSGLQWFAGIPGSMGGSLFNNIHGGTHHLSEYFIKAKVLIPKSDLEAVTKINKLDKKYQNKILENTEKFVLAETDFNFFEFDYDQSILRRKENQIVVLNLTLSLFESSDEQTKKAKYVAKEWLKRKRIQPQRSCGSVFQALSEKEQKRLQIPTPSAGYVIDKLLNLKGYKIGQAQISKSHANFIVNLDKAKAQEVLEIINLIKKEAKTKLDLELIPEINFLGNF